MTFCLSSDFLPPLPPVSLHRGSCVLPFPHFSSMLPLSWGYFFPWCLFAFLLPPLVLPLNLPLPFLPSSALWQPCALWQISVVYHRWGQALGSSRQTSTSFLLRTACMVSWWTGVSRILSYIMIKAYPCRARPESTLKALDSCPTISTPSSSFEANILQHLLYKTGVKETFI